MAVKFDIEASRPEKHVLVAGPHREQIFAGQRKSERRPEAVMERREIPTQTRPPLIVKACC
jgi:hypothetical protein